MIETGVLAYKSASLKFAYDTTLYWWLCPS